MAEQEEILEYYDTIENDSLLYVNNFLHKTPSRKQAEIHYSLKTHNHIICIWSRQTGKSTEIARVATHWLFFGKGKKNNAGEHIKECIYVFAPIKDQVQNLFYKIKEVIDSNSFLSNFIVKCNMDSIVAKNGNRIVFRSASPGAHIRGPTATKIIIDESQDITNEKYNADILPMGGTTDALILEAGTPMTKNHFYETMLVANRKEMEVKLIRQLWYECPFLSRKYVMRQKENSPEALWRQEWLAEFIEEGSTCFLSKWFERQKNGRSIVWDYSYYRKLSEVLANIEGIKRIIESRGITCVCGIDLGKEIDSTVITIVRTDKLPYVILYQEEFSLNKNYMEVAEIVKTLYDVFQFYETNVDYTSEKSFYDALVEKGIPLSYSKKNLSGNIVFKSKTKTEMINKVQVLIQKSLKEEYLIALPREADKFLLQMVQQQYEMTGGGKYKYYHPTNAHDDMLWSFLLACKNLSTVTSKSNVKDSRGAYSWKAHDEKAGREDSGRELYGARSGDRKDVSRWKDRLQNNRVKSLA